MTARTRQHLLMSQASPELVAYFWCSSWFARVILAQGPRSCIVQHALGFSLKGIHAELLFLFVFGVWGLTLNLKLRMLTLPGGFSSGLGTQGHWAAVTRISAGTSKPPGNPFSILHPKP